ncbi:MAG: class I SAM-dependent methyltransferase [Desulfobacterales bacterium]|nr:class I SAM-dependent methyltransferase [Desulfobacterales bacterium]
MPSDEELNEYYANKYYQMGKGSYSTEYSKEEVDYFLLKARLIYLKATQLKNIQKGNQLIDIGCGEGWIMNEFYSHNLSVTGLDFSKHGLEKFHPHLLPYFEQGNIFEKLQKVLLEDNLFDIVILANVIEHVKEPIILLEKIKKCMRKGAMLIIVVPNDFSSLHHILMEKKIITEEFWLCYPDHLSYFNYKSMINLLSDLGFKLLSTVSDNPIDLNLLNDNSNYIKDPDKGKKTHMFRVRMDNFLASIDIEKLLIIYETLGSMGVGRDLTYYCSI